MNNRLIIVLTQREKELYDLLADQPTRKWLSRDEIAQRNGKNHLSVHDFYLLDRLVDKNLIEKQLAPGTGKGKFQYCVVHEEKVTS